MHVRRGWRSRRSPPHVERGEQLPLSPLNDDASALNVLGFVIGGISILMGTVVAAAGTPEKALVLVGKFGGLALAAFGANLFRLSRWARQRERKAEAMAEQAVKLLADPEVNPNSTREARSIHRATRPRTLRLLEQTVEASIVHASQSIVTTDTLDKWLQPARVLMDPDQLIDRMLARGGGAARSMAAFPLKCQREELRASRAARPTKAVAPINCVNSWDRLPE